MKLKKNAFIFLNIVVPLILGLIIYVFMKNGTYINTFLKTESDYYPESILGVFIVNWFCDFLWAYALLFLLYFVLFPFQNRIAISSVMTFVLGTILEILQKFDVLTGTFDWWDIVIETIAVIVSVINLFFINKKFATEK
ncbi:MAG: hypothetical protein J6L89_06260 [Clostridia bacterium]|nr:hypothetical protein [Clostridia bacterium]